MFEKREVRKFIESSIGGCEKKILLGYGSDKKIYWPEGPIFSQNRVFITAWHPVWET